MSDVKLIETRMDVRHFFFEVVRMRKPMALGNQKETQMLGKYALRKNPKEKQAVFYRIVKSSTIYTASFKKTQMSSTI